MPVGWLPRSLSRPGVGVHADLRKLRALASCLLNPAITVPITGPYEGSLKGSDKRSRYCRYCRRKRITYNRNVKRHLLPNKPHDLLALETADRRQYSRKGSARVQGASMRVVLTWDSFFQLYKITVKFAYK